jgi:hypothetical protein
MIDFAHLPRPLRRVVTSAVGTYAAYVAYGLVHPRLLRSTATSLERGDELPGDDLVPEADWCRDFATTIAAPADEIWPWLAQMGYGRAGWYGWYPYENGGRGSPHEIIPALQDLASGDIIPDGPHADAGFGVWRVHELEPNVALVLHSRRHPTTGLEVEPDGDQTYIDCSWSFVLVPILAARTRLVVRVRAKVHAGSAGRIAARAARLVFGLGDAVMENTMLRGIRARAELAYQASLFADDPSPMRV